MLHRPLWLLVSIAALLLAGCPERVVGFDVGQPDTGNPDATMDIVQDTGADVPLPDIVDTGPRCLTTQIVCDGRCISSQIDPNNCGGCGIVCPMNTVCAAGGCHEHCPTGLQGCPDPTAPDAGPDGSVREICTDLQNSRLNCGTCGHVCPPTGTCYSGVCILDCGTRTICNAGGADGGATDGGTPYCADLSFDANNCGACGHVCPPMNICNAGSCVLDCVYPQTGCPPTGTITDSYCANLTTDNNNCGACGNVCSTGRTCRSGTCTLCAPPQTECPPSGSMTMPYCATLTSDVNNCGSCGHACTPPQTCGYPGTCICTYPLLACGSTCVDPRTDTNNCGSCGRVCGAGSYCSGSVCVLCAPRTLCPGGLCIDTTTDVNNCGTCGTVCPVGNVCQAGACICPTGSMVCSGTCVNLQTNVNNCGACGNACATGQYCVAGACVTRPPPGAYTIPFAPEATTGTAISLSDDSVSAAIPIGFSFRFFTNTYTSVYVSSNGFIGFTAGLPNGCCSGGTIPSATDGINNIIAATWTDMYPPGAGSVTYQTRGTSPNRHFVVSYTGVPFCCSSTPAVTTQIILFESTDEIEVHTATLATGTTGRIITQGVENAAGTTAYFRPGRVAAGFSLTNDAVQFFTY